MYNNFCIDCSKKLTAHRKDAIRCHACYKVILTKRLINNPAQKGIKLTEEHKIKLSKAKLGKPGNKKGYKLTEEQRKILSFSHGGNGIFKSELPNGGYPSEFNTSLKNKIRERDNFICQNCGMTQEEHFKKYNIKLNVHHIDYNKENCKESNLITACVPCNGKFNFNRDQWQKYFENKILNLVEK